MILSMRQLVFIVDIVDICLLLLLLLFVQETTMMTVVVTDVIVTSNKRQTTIAVLCTHVFDVSFRVLFVLLFTGVSLVCLFV